MKKNVVSSYHRKAPITMISFVVSFFLFFSGTGSSQDNGNLDLWALTCVSILFWSSVFCACIDSQAKDVLILWTKNLWTCSDPLLFWSSIFSIVEGWCLYVIFFLVLSKVWMNCAHSFFVIRFFFIVVLKKHTIVF